MDYLSGTGFQLNSQGMRDLNTAASRNTNNSAWSRSRSSAWASEASAGWDSAAARNGRSIYYNYSNGVTGTSTEIGNTTFHNFSDGRRCTTRGSATKRTRAASRPIRFTVERTADSRPGNTGGGSPAIATM